MAALTKVPAVDPPAKLDSPSSMPVPTGEASGSPLVEDWRTFHGGLRAAALKASESGAPLSLLMLDLRRLARSAGGGPGEPDERRLAEIVRISSAACPAQSIATRYASVRLIVVLPGSSLVDAAATARHLRAVLSEDVEGAPSDQAGDPGATIGVAEYHDGEPLCHLLQRAADGLDSDDLL
jgi:GGDEF domain-containing protein